MLSQHPQPNILTFKIINEKIKCCCKDMNFFSSVQDFYRKSIIHQKSDRYRNDRPRKSNCIIT